MRTIRDRTVPLPRSILALTAMLIKVYDAATLARCGETPSTLALNHTCRQIFECLVCQSGQAAPCQNSFQRLGDFTIPAGARDPRDYSIAPIASRHGSS
jgi:hypothetical protein